MIFSTKVYIRLCRKMDDKDTKILGLENENAKLRQALHIAHMRLKQIDSESTKSSQGNGVTIESCMIYGTSENIEKYVASIRNR